MTAIPANRSDCEAPRDSRRPINVMTLNVSVSHSATYLDQDGDGNTYGGHSVTMSGTGGKTWGRIPFPLVDPLTTFPGDGAFYLVQIGCCCKCRAAYVADLLALTNVSDRSGTVSIPFNITVTRQELDADGNADGDPVESTFPEGVTIELWNLLSPPCQRSDGPSGGPTARLVAPARPLLAEEHEYPPDSFTQSVTGEGAPILISTDLTGNNEYRWELPDPCSDSWTLSMEASNSWTGETIAAAGNVSVSLSVGS